MILESKFRIKSLHQAEDHHLISLSSCLSPNAPRRKQLLGGLGLVRGQHSRFTILPSSFEYFSYYKYLAESLRSRTILQGTNDLPLYPQLIYSTRCSAGRAFQCEMKPGQT
jgi:hypothetical protein